MKKIYLYFCGTFFCVSLLALFSTIWWTYTINLTESLPGTLYLIHKGASVTKGDLVAFKFTGGATYPAGTTFIKVVTGVPGDVVDVENEVFFVNDVYVGAAKHVSKAGVPLQASEPGVIKKNEYFVSTPSVDSLDSRYALNGNIKAQNILGKAYEIY